MISMAVGGKNFYPVLREGAQNVSRDFHIL